MTRGKEASLRDHPLVSGHFLKAGITLGPALPLTDISVSLDNSFLRSGSQSPQVNREEVP